MTTTPVSKYDIQLDLAKNPGSSRAFLVSMVGANQRVLDVGCDTGYLGNELAAFGNVTSGFEMNETAAEVARQTYAEVVSGDLEATDLLAAFGREVFDVVVFGDVLEHLRDPLPVLRQARGLLATGGSVLISVPNVAHGDVRLALLHGRWRYTKTGLLDETHTRFFTRESLLEFLADAGFVAIEIRRTRVPLFRSEVGVKEQDFAPELVAALRDDPEATTYQFVVRAVPHDAVRVTSEQAVLVDSLTMELEQQRRRVHDLAAREKALRAERDRLVEQIAAIRASETWRAGQLVVRTATRFTRRGSRTR